ncbi:hypothetical protein Salmuc_01841 [Salipiger mucosus DSM 16094]|uniref:Uncharacterized protein n=1 Tax=Salipiger mucosus DSM 16094 TaxID=1123237 RepID=S9QRQ3_9RHOB|nr:hypothetical protein Salmuc_01841 [Salipiger mucosus DSM 16094]
MSKQEVVARAINAVMTAHGKKPLLEMGHHRIVRRRNGKSKARSNDQTPHCRRGRRGVGGWYDYGKVQQLAEFSQEIDLSIQAIVEMGLKDITGMQSLYEKQSEIAD